ncbi:hypothetical protein [Runella sp.]|uniref:hypothetical protein n=1 Tax=Runella sp. TaxID=1960881 RepID=UPI003D0E17F4
MKPKHYIIACAIIIAFAVGISWIMSRSKITQSEKLEKDIKANEDTLQKIKAERAVDNAAPIPFSDDARQRAIDSINKHSGFHLSVRPYKRN